MRAVTVITGASAGIGAALAREFAAHGHELVLVARRAPELEALADQVARKGQPRPHVLPLDLQQPDVAARVGEALAAHDLEPQFIVNNAGFSRFGRAADCDRDEQLAMVDLNVRALVELSLAFVDTLARRRGGVLNVASVAAFMPGPGMAVYYASKAFVLSFSEALRCELAPRGVRVTALCPGPVLTEFQRRAGIIGQLGPRFLRRSPERVARAGYSELMAGRRCVIPGWENTVTSLLPRFLPRALVVRMMESVQLNRLGGGKAF